MSLQTPAARASKLQRLKILPYKLADPLHSCMQAAHLDLGEKGLLLLWWRGWWHVLNGTQRLLFQLCDGLRCWLRWLRKGEVAHVQQCLPSAAIMSCQCKSTTASSLMHRPDASVIILRKQPHRLKSAVMCAHLQGQADLGLARGEACSAEAAHGEAARHARVLWRRLCCWEDERSAEWKSQASAHMSGYRLLALSSCIHAAKIGCIAVAVV
jgi:hypothetical protein